MYPPRDELDPPAGLSVRLCRVLAGLDIGVAGGVAVLCWLVIHSKMSQELWWAKLNVAGALFYGADVYSMGLGRATLAGAALLLVHFAAAGTLFAQFVPLRGYARNSLFALAYSALLNVVAYRWVWPRLDPFAPAFFAFQVMLAGHLLFALALTRFPGRFKSLASTFGDNQWVALLYPKPMQTLAPTPDQPENPPDSSGAGAPVDTPADPPADPPSQPTSHPPSLPHRDENLENPDAVPPSSHC